jgi:hypothetical protein
VFTANAKVLAGLKDELIRLIVRKNRQSLEPSTATRGNKVLSRDIWEAGANVNGMGKDDVQILTKHNGVTESEFSVYELVARQIEEEIGVSKLFQGLTDTKLTATQARDQLRQAIKSIGPLVRAWSKVIREMTYQRIYNVIENGTDATDVRLVNGKAKKIFRAFTAQDSIFEDMSRGTKRIQFLDRDLTDSEEEKVYKHEEADKREGKNNRYKFINVNRLRALRNYFYVNVEPQEKDSTDLQKAMFKEELNDAVVVSKITGRQINPDTPIRRFERVWRSKKMFQEAPPQVQPTNQPQPGQPGPNGEVVDPNGPGDAAAQMTSAVGATNKRPSINTMANAVT